MKKKALRKTPQHEEGGSSQRSAAAKDLIREDGSLEAS